MLKNEAVPVKTKRPLLNGAWSKRKKYTFIHITSTPAAHQNTKSTNSSTKEIQGCYCEQLSGYLQKPVEEAPGNI